MINIKFPDGSVRTYEAGVTGYDVAMSISPRLAADVLAVSVKKPGEPETSKGTTIDLLRPINEDVEIRLLKWEDDEAKKVFWHSSSHLMAEALEALFPGVKFGIGPAIENGFYYDVDMNGRTLTDADFKAIEDKMLEFARQKQDFRRIEVPKAEAMAYFTEKGDQYKQELISELEDGTITYYTNGQFTDLCRGPHLRNTEVIKAVKVLSLAGAYWRGDETRQQLTRIYGITFPKKLRNTLENFLRKKQAEYGYLQVVTPHIGGKELYVTSGHYAKYGKDSFQPIHTPQEGEEFMLKPMNCPHHCEIYRSAPHSYKDLPLRYAEFGTVYRYEQSGELHGLTRVRGFTQDDAHLFCRQDQIQEEFEKVIDLILYVFKTLHFDKFTAQVSLRDPKNPSKYIGSDENWEKAEAGIIEAAKKKGLPFVVETGEAAFYGPKLDFMVKDAIGRSWQLGTIQVDYNLPKVLPVSEKYADYAKKVVNLLNNSEIRASIDDRNETLGKRIRETSLKRVPILVIVGEKEQAENTVSVRRGAADVGSMTTEGLVKYIQEAIREELAQ